jgi:hypothetical protein
MKIVPFPDGQDAGVDPAVIAELERALAGESGPGAEAWRELGSDIRALAPPIDAGFQSTLRRRFETPSPSEAGDSTSPAEPDGRHRTARRWGTVRRWAGAALRPRIALGGAGALAAIVLALIVVNPFAGEGTPRARPVARAPQSTATAAPTTARTKGPAEEQGAAGSSTPAVPAGKSYAESSAPAPDVSAPASASSAAATGSSPGRVEQRGASLTLAGTPGEVQQLADGVSRVVNAEGGYVTSSQVQVETEGSSNATLVLSVPSARLTQTLAALGRLGSVRAETQSLQDITDPYDAAKRALGDAVAERSALLRALATATTQGQIESLHRRLAIAGGAISRARTAFGAISSQAANSTIEVTVVGDAKAAGAGLTLSRGLHDAGRVLTVAGVIALIGLAALVPLLIVGLLLAFLARAMRRGARERALGGS